MILIVALHEGVSSRMHSRYTRTLSDLPVVGRRVVITVSVRRFRCVGPECRTKVFAERLELDLAASHAGRMGRLETVVHHLGLALDGRLAESSARRLMVPASRDTMLRTVRRRAQRPIEPLNVIGIDDWAFRRGHRYGTLICDLERRSVVALLPDRESGTVEAWLSVHPEIAVNHSRRLKTLRGFTPYECICQAWTKEPERFRVDPSHHIPGPYT